MGVSGVGKTTIGRLLALRLACEFLDADDFHPPANVAKMAAGRALNDADRAPWLAALRRHIDAVSAAGGNLVLACSALKAAYREVLTVNRPEVRVVHLSGSPELIKSRLATRRGHFMRPEMADSQFATLEPPDGALTLDVALPPDELVARIRRALGV